jgi:Sporulation and spore germination
VNAIAGTTNRTSRRLAVALAVAVALSVLLAGCGIPQDRAPRPFDRTRTSVPPPARPASRDVLPASGQRVFFVAGVGTTGASRLLPVVRDVHATALDVLTELFKGPTDLERGRRAQTAIPAETKVINAVSEAEGTIAVYLDNALTGTAGERQILAVAQIVYTLTALEGIHRVRILVNDAPREWPTEDGTPRSEPLTRFNYARFDPSTQPEFPPSPSPTEASSTAARTAPPTTVPPTTVPPTTVERTG